MLQNQNDILKDIKLLIVEDNKPTLDLLFALLSDLGVDHIESQESAEQAWLMTHNMEIDVAIIDWRLDGMTGMELIGKIRHDPGSSHKDLPIMMVTSYSNRDLVLEAKKLGVREFLAKPFTIKSLSEKLQRLLSKHSQQKMSSGDQDLGMTSSKADSISKYKKSNQYIDLRGGQDKDE